MMPGPPPRANLSTPQDRPSTPPPSRFRALFARGMVEMDPSFFDDDDAVSQNTFVTH